MTRIPQILQRISDALIDLRVERWQIEREDNALADARGIERRFGLDRRTYNAGVRKEAERRLAQRRADGW